MHYLFAPIILSFGLLGYGHPAPSTTQAATTYSVVYVGLGIASPVLVNTVPGYPWKVIEAQQDIDGDSIGMVFCATCKAVS
jgi:hypothetical protein